MEYQKVINLLGNIMINQVEYTMLIKKLDLKHKC